MSEKYEPSEAEDKLDNKGDVRVYFELEEKMSIHGFDENVKQKELPIIIPVPHVA